jgi:choline kinase
VHTAFEVVITGLDRSCVNAFLGRHPVTIAVLKNLKHEQTNVFSLLSVFYKAYKITSRGLYPNT